MKVLFVILASYASAGLAIALLLYAYRSAKAQQYLISDDPHRSTSDRELYWRVALNTTVSITLIFSVMYGLGNYLYYDHAAPGLALPARGRDGHPDLRLRVLLHPPLSPFTSGRSSAVCTRFTTPPGIRESSTASCCIQWRPSSGSACSSGQWRSSVACTSTSLGALFITYTAFNILNHAGIDVPHFPLKTLGSSCGEARPASPQHALRQLCVDHAVAGHHLRHGGVSHDGQFGNRGLRLRGRRDCARAQGSWR